MSEEQGAGDGAGGRVVGSKGPELGVAAFLMLIGGLVVFDSLRIGIGWGDDGPKSGYFPFYVGLMLCGASAWIFVRALVTGRGHLAEFATREQLGLVLAVLVPMIVYAGLIATLGIYVASLALIAWFMTRHGGYRWPVTLAVGIGVPLAFFLLFERWFLVLLPKGPLERLLGL